MLIFGNLICRMFYSPLFGATVMGQHWNVTGWKKVLVSLAGPLPGIAVGALFGIAGLFLHHTWMKSAALVLLLLNGLTLIPILPFDGGHVLQATLFCDHRWLDLVFRVIALAGLARFVLLGM